MKKIALLVKIAMELERAKDPAVLAENTVDKGNGVFDFNVNGTFLGVISFPPDLVQRFKGEGKQGAELFQSLLGTTEQAKGGGATNKFTNYLGTIETPGSLEEISKYEDPLRKAGIGLYFVKKPGSGPTSTKPTSAVPAMAGATAKKDYKKIILARAKKIKK